MSPRRTLATTGRVLSQLRHDPRTIALLVVVPCVLVTLSTRHRMRRFRPHHRQKPKFLRPVPRCS